MSQLTIFLSKFIGIYLIVVSLALLDGGVPYTNLVDGQFRLLNDHAALLTAGLIALAVSLALIRAHNIWSGGVLPVLVTLVGWILLIISITLLFITPQGLVSVALIFGLIPFFHIYGLILLVLGACMTYLGYRAKVHATNNVAQAIGSAHTEMS